MKNSNTKDKILKRARKPLPSSGSRKTSGSQLTTSSPRHRTAINKEEKCSKLEEEIKRRKSAQDTMLARVLMSDRKDKRLV